MAKVRLYTMREGEPRREIKKPQFAVEHFELQGKRSEMQDASGSTIIERGGEDVLVVAVADGHGIEGGYAARHASDDILNAARAESDELDRHWLAKHFETIEKGFENDNIAGGTTLTVAVIRGDRAIIGYVGDSEARSIGPDGTFSRLIIPHRPREHEDELARLIAQKTHLGPRGHIELGGTGMYIAVSRALGDKMFESLIRHDPEIVETTLSPDARFLVVASDGLWDALMAAPPEARTALARALVAAKNAEEARRCIETLIATLNLQRQDNLTAEIIDLGDRQAPARRRSPRGRSWPR